MKLIKLLLVMFIPIIGFSQTLKLGDGLQVVHFNAGWNSANDVKWVEDLSDCKIKQCDIATDIEAQNEHEIVVVPTIIIFILLISIPLNKYNLNYFLKNYLIVQRYQL